MVPAFVRMTGSTIAAPEAAVWVTDFLNAAYYARPAAERSPADLRLAHGLLTTRWWRQGARRLRATDVVAFHRAFGAARLSPSRGGFGRLDREALLAGSASLIGDWFAEAWADPARRAHGIAFESKAERVGFDPSVRALDAALGATTPPLQDAAGQRWSTYPSVALPDARAALELLLDPARWPDIGSAGGRFTALAPGGLEGQTFEIDLVLEAIPRAPLATRGYVTCTALHTGADAARALAALPVDPELPGTPLALVELTTHEGHALGRAVSRLALSDVAICDIGAWDPLTGALRAAYAAGGHDAQAAFWGPQDPDRSMLVQLARTTAS